ncbi:hypothetical protein BT69DRAFT_172215 [Atractiella rhizophila]|nr:hypothetical protein BT69DRAFT_172215 [Atractiella rhizophila]
MIPLLIFALSCLNPRATAQSSDAVPQAGFEFFNNVFGESPCVVASKIFARCQNSTFTLWSLPAGNWAYPGPTNSSQEWWNWNRCDCSMPVYNLLSACAESQGASWPSFFQHTEKCNFEYTGDNEGAIYSLPIELPTNTQLPSWAMFNSSENKGSTFTDRQARLDAGLSVDKKGSDRTPFLIGGSSAIS